MKVFHPSIEGAQHGLRGLENFLAFAEDRAAGGAQPSCYMLQAAEGTLMPAREILDRFDDHNLLLDGVSAHCPFWVHTSAWTETRTVWPFIPAELRGESAHKIEDWAETYCLRLLDHCLELGVKVIPMFWGLAYGLEVATGYPWGLWQFESERHSYDLIAEGAERFVSKTARIRSHANDLEVYLAHEIHPGTAAMCAEDFLHLRALCDNDPCLVVNADPSHCWEGESWQVRFERVADYIYGCHMKNYYEQPGHPLRSMQPDWQKRGMHFTELHLGDINLRRYAELMYRTGYSRRYCELHATASAPLVVEAESAHADLDSVAGEGIDYVGRVCCFEVAQQSFEEGMGASD